MVRTSAVGILISVTLAGCASSIPRVPVPQALVETAEVRGMADVRFWGDEKSAVLDRSLASRVTQIKATRSKELRPTGPINASYLALSGGGGDGAFGAGLLCGWTAAGSRPQFEIVTGVSTGALMAPYAFLGSQYDDQLKKLYTTLSTKQVLTPNLVDGLFGGSALADSAPLANRIREHVDAKLMREIAAEHARGRRLFVATTNLDAQRQVVWDLGALATIGTPASIDLFQRVLLASASIPGVFPPVHLKVTANGQTYEEMHVDGGTTAQVFFLPTQVLLDPYAKDKVLAARLRRHLYIIRNTKVAPEYQAVDDSTFTISGRSLFTLTKTQGVGDLYRLYLEAHQNRMTYQLAAMPPEFTLQTKEPFDPVYMAKLFDIGYQAGAAGYKWQTAPPGVIPDQLKVPPVERAANVAKVTAPKAPETTSSVTRPQRALPSPAGATQIPVAANP